MVRRPSLIGLTVAALVSAGCGDQPTGVGSRLPTPPAFMLYDGAHNGGNPGFFLLPPLVANPSGDREFGDSPFAASVAPRVEICQLQGNPNLGPTACIAGAPILTFSGSQITVAPPVFHVNWHTDQVALVNTAFYRIGVFVGAQAMGFADIDPVANAGELKRAKTGEVITLVNGRTLPIRFTIEQEALCPSTRPCTIVRVTNAGGSFTIPSGAGGILLRPGWLPSGITEVTMTLVDVAVGPDNICHTPGGFTGAGLLAQFEGCMSITTEPALTPGPTTGIQKEAIIGLCLETDGENSIYLDFLQIFKSDPGLPLRALEDADPSVILGFSCEGYTGNPAPPPVIGLSSHSLFRYASARMDGLSRRLARLFEPRPVYAIDLGEGGKLPIGEFFSYFGWGVRPALTAVSPASQEVNAGGVARISARVTGSTHGAEPVVSPLSGVLVTFTPGSGSVSPTSAWTDVNGVAFTDWTVPTAPGAYTLVASIAGGAPVSFAVTVPTGPTVAAVQICTTESLPEYCDSDPSIYDDYPPYDQYEFRAIPRDAAGNNLGGAVSCTWNGLAQGEDPRLGSITPTTGNLTTFTANIGQYGESGATNPAYTLTATCAGVSHSIVLSVYGGSSVSRVDVTSSPAVTSITVGSSVQLTAKPVDAAGALVARVPCTSWSSSDPGRITVSPTTGYTTTATAVAPGVGVVITAVCGASVTKTGTITLNAVSPPG